MVLKVKTWTHVALTWKKAENAAIVYLDAVPTEGNIDTFPEVYPAVRIGTGYASRFAEGLIDEVRMWSTALSQKELEANMEKGYQDILAIRWQGKLSTCWGRIKAQY